MGRLTKKIQNKKTKKQIRPHISFEINFELCKKKK